MKKVTNKNLQDAKKAKNDEFYTRIEDIEKELTREFGRGMKLVLAQDAPAAPKPALSGRDVSNIFDIFPERDKINLVD